MSMRNNEYPALLNWPRSAGRKPDHKVLKNIHEKALARRGSKDAVALAMALRPEGATQPQIISVLGSPHRNKFNELVRKRKVRLSKFASKHGLTVYKLELKV